MARRRTQHARPTALAVAVSEKRGIMTQAEAAAAIGISQGTMSAIERGAPLSLATAQALAAWLGMSIGAVVDAARAEAPPSP